MRTLAFSSRQELLGTAAAAVVLKIPFRAAFEVGFWYSYAWAFWQQPLVPWRREKNGRQAGRGTFRWEIRPLEQTTWPRCAAV